MDPLATAAAGVAVGQAGLGLLGFVRDRLSGDDIIAAMFDPDGTRVYGDDRIVVRRSELSVVGQDGADRPLTGHWCYSVQEVSGFTFVAFAVHPAAEFLFVPRAEDPTPTTAAWRWVAPRRSGEITNIGTGGVNLVVPFIVVGYRTKALVDYFAKTPVR